MEDNPKFLPIKFIMLGLLILINIFAFSILFEKYKRTKNEYKALTEKIDGFEYKKSINNIGILKDNLIQKSQADVKLLDVSKENKENNINAQEKLKTETTLYESIKPEKNNLISINSVIELKTKDKIPKTEKNKEDQHSEGNNDKQKQKDEKDTIVSDIGRNIHGGLGPLVTANSIKFEKKDEKR